MKQDAIKNESLLVRNLSKGNLLSFNTLFKEYSGGLFHFAKKYLKSEADAEDLVQEVFIIIWEKRADLKEELSFKSFLFTIAFNIIRKHFRTKAYLVEYFKTRINDVMDIQTSQEIAYNSLCQYLTELVNHLPRRRKEIFLKSRLEGYTIKEIAEGLKISHKTVENQLTDALKFVRTNLCSQNLQK